MASFFDSIKSKLAFVGLTDVIDILLVTYVLYKALKFIRDTRTVQLLKGIGFLFIVMQFSGVFKLYTVNYILSNAMQLGVIAIFIVFQPELRRALEQLGNTSIGNFFSTDISATSEEKAKMIDEIIEASQNMSKNRIGALMVVEREYKLGDIINTGIKIDAETTSELLMNIFIPKTPLHDGAVVIRNERIDSATCFLPLSQNPNLSKELGTRHRAGLGISEESDAIVVIVSEETGNISLAYGGELYSNITPEYLKKELLKLLNVKDSAGRKQFFNKRGKN